MFHLQSFRGALPIFPPSVVLSAVMWAELDVCFHTAVIQRDTVLPPLNVFWSAFKPPYCSPQQSSRTLEPSILPWGKVTKPLVLQVHLAHWKMPLGGFMLSDSSNLNRLPFVILGIFFLLIPFILRHYKVGLTFNYFMKASFFYIMHIKLLLNVVSCFL